MMRDNNRNEANHKTIRGILNTSKKDFALILVVLSVISVMLISSAIFGFVKLKEVQSRDVAYNAEQLRTLAYDKIEGDQYADEGEHVKFAPFFAEDYKENKYSEKLLGACNEISSKETMYIELGVNNGGKLQNGKITINSRNFTYSMRTLKNSILKKDCVGNIREIELNEISSGNSALFMGDIYASITSANDYSQESEITLTGTWVSDDESESVEINKTMKVTVDWYGSAKADISAPYTRIDLNDFRTSSDKTVRFDFTIMETKWQLLPKQNVIDVTIPEMFGQSPEEVTCISGEYKYDKDTHKLHIERTNSANNTRYIVQLKYPEEAYNQLYNGYTMSVDIEGYYDCYNNPNEEFNNKNYEQQEHNETGIFRTPKVKATKGISFYTEAAVTADYVFSAQIRNKSYISVPTSTYAMSKENLIDMYDGNKEVGTVDYTVMWSVTKTTKETETPLGITMKEIEKDGGYGDTWDGYQMSDYVKNTKIYFKNSNFISETGYVKVYDNDTDTVIKEFTAEELKENYNTETQMYTFDAPITHIRIETSEVDPSAQSYLEVYCVKEVDKEALKSHFTKEQIAGIQIAKTNLNGILSNGASVTGSDECAMVTEKSYSTIKVSDGVLSAIEKNPVDEKITIEVPNKNVSYADWKNGVFLVGFESSNASKTESPLSYLEINNVSIRNNNNNVKISGYELLKKDGKYFIKIVTNNETKTSGFTIDVDCKVLVNPMVSSSTIHVNLYSYNDNLNLYHYGTNDRYDVNDNGNTNETVGLSTATINISSLNTFMTTETASEYNEEGEVTIAPNIAEVQKVNAKDTSTDKTKATAKINVSLINNYDRGEVNNVVILGKIPFKDNTYVDESASLGSKFTTTMIEGIQLPDTMSKELKEATKIYYSKEEDPKIEGANTENSGDGQNTESGKVIRSITEEWLERNKFEEITEDTDLSEIKSYLIVIKNEKNLVRGTTYTFSYTISIPDNAETNAVSYSCHKIWYDYTSEDTRLAMNSQPNKLGIRVVDYYDFEILKVKKDTDHPVQGAKFKLTEMQDKENQGDSEDQKDGDPLENGEEIKEISRIITSDTAGKIELKNLRINQAYSLQEIQAPEAYELDSKIIRFKVVENTDSTSESQDNNKYKIVYLSEDGEQQETETTDKFNENVEVSKNTEGKYIFTTKIENTPKFALNITKTDKDTQEDLSGVIFEISNENTNERAVTNSEGKAVFNNLKIGQEYTLSEIYAKGYYLMKEVKFTLEENKEGEEAYSIKYEEETATEECTFTEEKIQSNGDSDLIQVNVNITNEKIPTYKLKIKKVAESEEKIGPEEEKEEEGLEGATFLLERRDMGNSEFFTTDENGNISVTDLYAKTEGQESITGKYTLKETAAPAGYLNNREEINFVVTKEAESAKATEPQGQEGTAEETNTDTEKAKYQVKLIKTKTEEGGDDLEEQAAEVKDFDTLKDIKVDGDTITITIQDKPLFKLTKIDASTNKPLANAEFIIYELKEDGTIGEEAKDPNGNYVGTLNEKGKHVVTTNAQGVITLALGPGNYKAIETGFPEGYEDTPHSEVFTISGKEEEKSQIVEPKIEEIEVPASDKKTTKEFKISKIEDLLDLSYAVNSGITFSNTKVVLENDLDFESDSSYRTPNSNYKYNQEKMKQYEENGDTTENEQDEGSQDNTDKDINGDGTTETVKEELTEKTEDNAKGFPSIGTITILNYPNYIYKPFSGIFDGQGHTISNLYINDGSNGSYKGLFGYIESAVIKDLTVTGEITGKNYVGGICGVASGKVYLENLNNECKINTAGGYAGGILGSAGAIKSIEVLSMKSCTNNGTVTISDPNSVNVSMIAGIVGQINNGGMKSDVETIASIEKCKNTSNMDNSKGSDISGICGYISNVEKVKIEDVENSGNITGSSYTSGIIGQIYNGTKLLNISNVNNSGSITGDGFTGSIIGYLMNNDSVNILNAKNTGSVSGSSEVGGLIGENQVTQCMYIKNCSNEGNVTASSNHPGGLIGYDRSRKDIFIIESCNKGDIKAASGEYIGGLIGYSQTYSYSDNKNIYIKSSYNTGNIMEPDSNKNGYNAGLIGECQGSQLQIEYSYNTGKIGKNDTVGGLVGRLMNKSTRIYKCYNSGTIECGSDYTGGLIGRNQESTMNIESSNNLGNIVKIKGER